jgi:uncharacterized protein YndB with AHSA1/START domain
MDNQTNKELKMTRTFDAPRELVYNAWTDPELVKQWWGPNGVHSQVNDWQAQPGGKIDLIMIAGEELGDFKDQQWPMGGAFVELDKPTKIVFTANAINEGKVILEHRTTVTFEEKNGKTEMNVHVVVTKVLPGSEFAIKGMEQGWNQQLDKLVKFVADHQ